MNAWRADPLVWGHGPRVFEVFREATCPFSIRAFGKLEDLLDKAGEDRITVKVRLQSQPWYMCSGVIVRCILAASTLEGGNTAAKSVMVAAAAHREEFEFDHHCIGPNLDATPTTSSGGSSAIVGCRLPSPSRSPISTARSSGAANMPARMGIHVSPTFMVDGLVPPDMSSSDPSADWVARLSDH
jgi:hypothetical protein